MNIHYESIIPAPIPDVFAFFNDIQNLKRITPASMNMKILEVDGDMGAGTRISMRVQPFIIPLTWVAHIVEVVPNQYFVDTIEKGPFARWRHRHEFHPHENGTRLVDDVDFQLPLYPLSSPAERWIARPQLLSMLEHRHAETLKFFKKRK